MKSKILILSMLMLSIFEQRLAHCQWINSPIGTNTFNQPDYVNYPTIESVGIGDFAAFAADPNSAFDINTNYFPVTPEGFATYGEVFRTDCPDEISTYWRMLRGTVEYGTLYNLSGEPHWRMDAPEGDLVFHAFGTNGTPAPLERMRITNGIGLPATNVNVTRIGVNYRNVTPYTPILTPISMLHLGEMPPVIPQGGQRRWMDVGTFNCLETDNAYFGLKYEASDHLDAVINWGDNAQNFDGADNLRFIFSAPYNAASSDQAQLQDGLEVGRFSAYGRMGIGNFTQNAIGGGSSNQPIRRLEIYDEHLNPRLGGPAPQLRLTYDPSYGVNGTHADVLKTVDLHERGEGTLHIYAPDLSSGLYNYSLIVDGKVIETKTMVKTR